MHRAQAKVCCVGESSVSIRDFDDDRASATIFPLSAPSLCACMPVTRVNLVVFYRSHICSSALPGSFPRNGRPPGHADRAHPASEGSQDVLPCRRRYFPLRTLQIVSGLVYSLTGTRYLAPGYVGIPPHRPLRNFSPAPQVVVILAFVEGSKPGRHGDVVVGTCAVRPRADSPPVLPLRLAALWSALALRSCHCASPPAYPLSISIPPAQAWASSSSSSRRLWCTAGCRTSRSTTASST